MVAGEGVGLPRLGIPACDPRRLACGTGGGRPGDGRARLESTGRAGTAFRLTLPEGRPASTAVIVGPRSSSRDESIVARDLQQTLAGLGYDAFAVAASAEEAWARAAERRPDVALVDIRIKGRTDGIKTAQHLQERFGVPIVYLTAHADDATLERAKQIGPYGYLLKPVKPTELKGAIEIALFRHGIDTAPPDVRDAPSHDPRPPRRPRGRRAPPAYGSCAARSSRSCPAPTSTPPAARRSSCVSSSRRPLPAAGSDLTQSAIATRVFDRRDDFDAVVDPIVRIQAGRLRRSLERYYLLSGKNDPVRIALPRGAYVPAFSSREGPEPALPEPLPEAATPSVLAEEWPAVLVTVFETGAATTLGEAATQLNEELVLELGRYRDVRALLHSEMEAQESSRRARARFSIEGRLKAENDDLRVTARLVDHATGEQVWGDEFHTAPRPGRWSGTPDDIARVIAARVGAEEGVIVQLLAAEHRRQKSAAVTSYDALLRAFEFFLSRDPDRFSRALHALRRTVEAEPECGPAWTRLARLYLANHCYEATSIATPIEDAITYAHHGVRIDPTSRRARCMLAAGLLTKGELAAARAELEEALRLSADSLVYLEIIGFLLTLLGDGERGPALIRSARQRNPHCLPQASFGLWFDHLRRGEVELAYQDALEYRDSMFFWRAVMRACCLGLLGRKAEAKAEAAEVLRTKPDFEQRGRVLIGYYIKLPDVKRQVVEGLARAGLTLA